MTKYNMIMYILIMPVYSHRDSVPFDWIYEPCHAKTDLEKIARINKLKPSRPTFLWQVTM